ncbi:MAG TPA: thioesterase family protein [bacterium]|nr:thioesterase family protein [bacterium]
MDWKTQIRIPVRFADVDLMGHVNNAKYVTYLEESRVAYFRQFPDLDFTKADYVPGYSVIVASLKLDYRSPAYLNETLVIGLGATELRRSSFSLEYTVEEEKSRRLVATASTVMVYFDYKAQKSCEIPGPLRKRFEEVEGRSFPK